MGWSSTVLEWEGRGRGDVDYRSKRARTPEDRPKTIVIVKVKENKHGQRAGGRSCRHHVAWESLCCLLALPSSPAVCSL
jgi:hypothetical protein